MSGVIFGGNVRLRGTVFFAVMLLVLLIMTVFPVSIAGKIPKPTSSSSAGSSPHTPAPATGRRPNSAAIPRKKHAAVASSKSVSSLWKSLGNNDAVKKWTRKLKGSSFFSSDIERWVLTLTDPSEDAIHLPTMQRLSQAITDSNRNIDLAMIVLGKLSRKLCEDSAFTKFKALLVLHHLISPGLLSAGDCAHMMASIVALRKERDARNDMKKFFARQSVDLDSMAPPATVSELALSNIIADYYDYLFSFVERSYQRKSSRDKVIANRAGQLENKSWSEMHNMNRELTQILSKIVEDGLGRQGSPHHLEVRFLALFQPCIVGSTLDAIRGPVHIRNRALTYIQLAVHPQRHGRVTGGLNPLVVIVVLIAVAAGAYFSRMSK
jgi:hypothetical protein